jgi:transposase-like protein
MAKTVLAPMPERLAAAQQDVAETFDAYNLAKDARDELVRDAVEEGMHQRDVARALGCRPGNVSRILAKPDARDRDDDDA